MIYMFIKMSKWYGVGYSSIDSYVFSIAMGHIRQGTIVVFTDDIDTFKDEMNINDDEIELAK